MAKFYEKLDAKLTAFIAEQKVFFTATAASAGRINLSPKGMDTFRCLDERTVGYLDLTGSGNETAAHLRLDRRMTIMFCSFAREPLILRLYGQGEVVPPGSAAWQSYAPHFPELPGSRQIVLMHVESLQTSCGYGVPRYKEGEERPLLIEWSEKKGEAGLRQYRLRNNRVSIDGFDTGLADAQIPVD